MRALESGAHETGRARLAADERRKPREHDYWLLSLPWPLPLPGADWFAGMSP
jgi:hypothetical protein